MEQGAYSFTIPSGQQQQQQPQQPQQQVVYAQPQQVSVTEKRIKCNLAFACFAPLNEEIKKKSFVLPGCVYNTTAASGILTAAAATGVPSCSNTFSAGTVGCYSMLSYI